VSEEQARDLMRDGALTIEAAVEFSGLGRTRLYELMTAGEIRYLKAGARRLIPKVELQNYLAGQLTATR
jgi:excisionase family DNA binding protein